MNRRGERELGKQEDVEKERSGTGLNRNKVGEKWRRRRKRTEGN